MVKHPDTETLARFAKEELPSKRQASVRRHLARCADCQGRLVATADPTEYEAAFSRAASRVSELRSAPPRGDIPRPSTSSIGLWLSTRKRTSVTG